MKEILITSTVLILALVILRRIFRSTLSRRVQYALWGLVLVRLLVPVSLPAVDFSVLTAAQPIEETVSSRIAVQPGYIGFFDRSAAVAENKQSAAPEEPELKMGAPAASVGSSGTVNEKKISISQAVSIIWKAGMAAAGLFFIISNLLFWLRLRKCRRLYPVEGTERKVYLVDDRVFTSPFIFGLIKPAIYLTPAALTSEQVLRHVLVHEETHARHLDQLWSLLRCVCLTVYWFDPFVWLAAACSKTDCELACDEGALARLGENQRIAYGETLLSLIPVRNGAGNPFIAATTMAARKKQIKDRLNFIVRKPKQLAAALAAVIILAGIVTACTFTGAKTQEEVPEEITENQPESNIEAEPETDTANVAAALTGSELKFFNEQWFNAGYNDIRNQFMSSIYEKPEDINLYELLYCEGSMPSDEELENILNMDPNHLRCPAYKLTTGEIDEILTRYMGLTLDETNKVGLDSFRYDEETDAYYWAHGDTNYRSSVEFSAATTDGRTVKLYYEDIYMGEGWKCLTLTSTPGNVYHFVSNVTCDKPVMETLIPYIDPYAVISLENLEPYSPESVNIEVHTGDYIDDYENRIDNWDFYGHNIVIYRATDGYVYAAERISDDTMNVFLTVTEESHMFFYEDLFGHNGFYIDYPGQYDEHSYGPVRDYYYFEDDGTLMLLARCETHADGDPKIIDLDGDGASELVSTRQMFYERDGKLYEARLPELLEDACPELYYWDGSILDSYSKCIAAYGVGMGWSWTRYIYYDGESLFVYKIDKTYTDNVVDGAATGVPEEVISAAKDYVEGNLRKHPTDGTYIGSDGETVDDWRIESFSGPYTYEIDGVTVEAWAFNYELHTTTPEKVVLAGGKYLTEDDWVSPGYPGADWMFFIVEDGTRTLSWRSMINDMTPDSEAFLESIKNHM